MGIPAPRRETIRRDTVCTSGYSNQVLEGILRTVCKALAGTDSDGEDGADRSRDE
jgi:hypothetical protein